MIPLMLAGNMSGDSVDHNTHHAAERVCYSSPVLSFFFTRIRTSEKVSKIGLEQNLFFRLKSAGVGCG